MSDLITFKCKIHKSGYEWDTSLSDTDEHDRLVPKNSEDTYIEEEDTYIEKDLPRDAFMEFANLCIALNKKKADRKKIIEDFYNKFGMLDFPVETIGRDSANRKIYTIRSIDPSIKIIEEESRRMREINLHVKDGLHSMVNEQVLDEDRFINIDLKYEDDGEGGLGYKFVPRYLISALYFQFYDNIKSTRHIKVCQTEDCEKLFLAQKAHRKTCSGACRTRMSELKNKSKKRRNKK